MKTENSTNEDIPAEMAAQNALRMNLYREMEDAGIDLTFLNHPDPDAGLNSGIETGVPS